MKNRMLRFETYSFYDSTGMERHLEHMAARGWMIEQISAFGWRYRRIPPTQIHFAVAYYPPASDFDPEPTEGQRTLQDFCVRTGWQLACTQAQIQIYYNEDADPLPLETDPVVKVTTLHRAAKSLICMLFTCCWQLHSSSAPCSSPVSKTIPYGSLPARRPPAPAPPRSCSSFCA